MLNRDFIAEASEKKNNPAFVKVPGSLVPVGQMTHERDKIKTELKKKSLLELRDMLARQEKLVNNKHLVHRLPDKGEKVRLKHEVLAGLVAEREKEEDLVSALAKLHLPDTEAMEWNNKILPRAQDDHQDQQDKDNSLRVLAEGAVPRRTLPAGTAPRRTHPDEEQDSLTRQNADNDFLTRKVNVLDEFKSDKRFVPFCSTELAHTRVDLPPPPAVRKSEKMTPAVKTPSIPLPTNYLCTTKLLSVKESLETQRIQNAKLREASLRQAAARLAGATGVTTNSRDTESTKISKPQKIQGPWRESKRSPADLDSDDDDDNHDAEELEENQADSDDEVGAPRPEVILDSDDEVHDDDAAESGGIVVQTFLEDE